MATDVESEKKNAELVSKAQDAAVQKIIGEAKLENLSEQRLNRLKEILKDILIDIELDEYIKDEQNKKNDLVKKIKTQEKTLSENNQQTLIDLYFQLLTLNPKLISEINDEIGRAEEKLKQQAIDQNKDALRKLNTQDSKANDNFHLKIKKNTPEPKSKLYASKTALIVGATLFSGSTIYLIAAGTILAASGFPLGLAVFGAALIIGAGLYYAIQRRKRLAKFLPLLYAKAKIGRDRIVAQLKKSSANREIVKLDKKYRNRFKKERKKMEKEQDENIKDMQEELDKYIEKREEFKTKKENIESIIQEIETECKTQSLKKSDKVSILSKYIFSKLEEMDVKFNKKKSIEELVNYLNSIKLAFSEKENFYNASVSSLENNIRKIRAEMPNKLEQAHAENEELLSQEKDAVRAEDLPWYKAMLPNLKYWGSCGFWFFRTYYEGFKEFQEVISAAAIKIKENYERQGVGLPPGLQKDLDYFIQNKDVQNAAEQLTKFKNMVAKYGFDVDIEQDCQDYIFIDLCCKTAQEVEEAAHYLSVGQKVDDTIIDIFLVYPKAVLNVPGKNRVEKAKNIHEVISNLQNDLNYAKLNLKKAFNEVEVYFPEDSSNRYKLVCKNAEQVEIFEKMLSIKLAVVQINQTLDSWKFSEEEKKLIQNSITQLMRSADVFLSGIEKQFDILALDKKTNEYRGVQLKLLAAYHNENLLEFVNSVSLTELVSVLSQDKLDDFFKNLKEKNNDSISQEARKLIDEYNSLIEREDFDRKYYFIEALKKSKDSEGLQLVKLMRSYLQKQKVNEEMFVDSNQSPFFSSARKTANYMQKTMHIYQEQNVLLEKRQRFLEEMEKAFVLSVPEVAEKLNVNSESYKKYKKRCRKSRVKSWGEPYVVDMSFSIDALQDLFSSLKIKFSKMKKLFGRWDFSKLKLGDLSISDFSLNLGDILKLFDGFEIKGMVIQLDGLLEKADQIPTIKLSFGGIISKIRKEINFLSGENYDKFVNIFKGLLDFLDKIPKEFKIKGFKFSDLTMHINSISLDLERLRLNFDQFKGFKFGNIDVGDIKSLNLTLKELNALRIRFLKLRGLLESGLKLKELINSMPDSPYKSILIKFSNEFYMPVMDFLEKINLEIGKMEFLSVFDKISFDDFVFIFDWNKNFGLTNLLSDFKFTFGEFCRLEIEVRKLRGSAAESDISKLKNFELEFEKIKIKLDGFKRLIKGIQCISGIGEDAYKLLLKNFPGLPKIDFSVFNDINLKFGSFDDFLFVLSFLNRFGSIRKINFEFERLKNLISEFSKAIQALESSNDDDKEERLKALRLKFGIAIRDLEEFKIFFERLKGILDIELFKNFKLPVFDGFGDLGKLDFTFDFDGIINAVKGLEQTIDFAALFYSLKENVSSVSNFGFDMSNISWPSFPGWPSFSQGNKKPAVKRSKKPKSKNKKALSGVGEISFNVSFSPDLITLDEIIEALERLKRLNTQTRDQIVEKMDNEYVKKAKEIIGLKEEDRQIKEHLNKVHDEVDQKLTITLKILYAIKTAMSVIDAIKRGDTNALLNEVSQMTSQSVQLQKDIETIVGKIYQLKTLGTKSSDQVELYVLTQELSLKTEALSELKARLLALKNLCDTNSLNTAIDFNTMPISEITKALNITSQDIKKIMDMSKTVSKELLNTTLKGIEVSEAVSKIALLVNLSSDIDFPNIPSELQNLLQEIEFLKLKGNFSQKDLESIENKKCRLLDLKQLSLLASEVSNIDFSADPYLAMLNSLNIDQKQLREKIESVGKISLNGIDALLEGLELAAIPLKLALIKKNVAIMKECFKEDSKFFKFFKEQDFIPLEDLSSKTFVLENGESVSFYEVMNAEQNIQKLLEELGMVEGIEKFLNSEEMKFLESQRKAVLEALEEEKPTDTPEFLVEYLRNYQMRLQGYSLKQALEALNNVDNHNKGFATLGKVSDFIEKNKAAIMDMIDQHENLMYFIQLDMKIQQKKEDSQYLNSPEYMDDLKKLTELNITVSKTLMTLENASKTRALYLQILNQMALDTISYKKRDGKVEMVLSFQEFLRTVDKFYKLNTSDVLKQRQARVGERLAQNQKRLQQEGVPPYLLHGYNKEKKQKVLKKTQKARFGLKKKPTDNEQE